jgi:CRISPR-associated protein Cmr1
LHWGECLQESAQNPSAALKLLHEREAELFGAAAKDKKERGQGLFFIKLKEFGDLKSSDIESSWPTNNDAEAGYLGYGLDKTKDDPHRKAIKTTIFNHESKTIEPRVFSISLVLKKNITEAQNIQLKHTLKLWGLLGGLGSRSRRGFGSINLTKLDDETLVFSNLKDYQKTISELVNSIKLASSMPIFTALNESMQIAVVGRNQNYETYKLLMDEVGRQYKESRKLVNGLDRAVFGLPLEGLRGQRDIKNRRSSPLLLHIHKLNSGYIGVFSFIPAEFHPAYPEGRELDFYTTLDKYMKTMTRIYP